jgi:hypothetical protein
LAARNLDPKAQNTLPTQFSQKKFSLAAIMAAASFPLHQ